MNNITSLAEAGRSVAPSSPELTRRAAASSVLAAVALIATGQLFFFVGWILGAMVLWRTFRYTAQISARAWMLGTLVLPLLAIAADVAFIGIGFASRRCSFSGPVGHVSSVHCAGTPIAPLIPAGVLSCLVVAIAIKVVMQVPRRPS